MEGIRRKTRSSKERSISYKRRILEMLWQEMKPSFVVSKKGLKERKALDDRELVQQFKGRWAVCYCEAFEPERSSGMLVKGVDSFVGCTPDKSQLQSQFTGRASMGRRATVRSSVQTNSVACKVIFSSSPLRGVSIWKVNCSRAARQTQKCALLHLESLIRHRSLVSHVAAQIRIRTFRRRGAVVLVDDCTAIFLFVEDQINVLTTHNSITSVCDGLFRLSQSLYRCMNDLYFVHATIDPLHRMTPKEEGIKSLLIVVVIAFTRPL